MVICQYKRAYTLAELMTVLLIVSILMSLTIPKFQRTVERAHLRDANSNLLAVHAANQNYRAENLQYWPTLGGWKNLTDAAPNGINASLRLAIIPNGFEYRCQKNGPGYRCQACRPQCTPSTYQVTITEVAIDSSNPNCTGSCP